MAAADLDLGYRRRRSCAAPGRRRRPTWRSRPGDRDGGRGRDLPRSCRGGGPTSRAARTPGRCSPTRRATPPGRLIDAAGCKGLRLGTAEVSTKHANFIQADAGGSADDVVALMAEVRRRVLAHAGVDLDAETRLVGFPEPDPRVEVERRGFPVPDQEGEATATAPEAPPKAPVAVDPRMRPAASRCGATPAAPAERASLVLAVVAVVVARRRRDPHAAARRRPGRRWSAPSGTARRGRARARPGSASGRAAGRPRHRGGGRPGRGPALGGRRPGRAVAGRARSG